MSERLIEELREIADRIADYGDKLQVGFPTKIRLGTDRIEELEREIAALRAIAQGGK